MNFYDVDVLDRDSGEVRKTPMYSGWNEYSANLFKTTMCDCNLAGHRERGFQTTAGEWTWQTSAHENHAYEYNQLHACDHSMPPKRFQALRVYLRSGEVIELAS